MVGPVEAIDLLAQNYFGNTREGSLAGPIGAFVIAALAVATVLLIRNMSVRIRRLPNSFSHEGSRPADPMSENPESQEQSG